MLSACMQHHWKYCQDLEDKKRATEIPGVPVDPLPLEDNLAKHIIYVMSRFIYQVGFLEDREHSIVTNHHSTSNSMETLVNINSPTSLTIDIYKAASRVVAYVSASNWSITFAKIKNRILYLTTTQEENPEITDVMLLECASLNCKRLSMVLTGKNQESTLCKFLTVYFRIMQLNFTFTKISTIIYCSHA